MCDAVSSFINPPQHKRYDIQIRQKKISPTFCIPMLLTVVLRESMDIFMCTSFDLLSSKKTPIRKLLFFPFLVMVTQIARKKNFPFHFLPFYSSVKERIIRETDKGTGFGSFPYQRFPS